MRGGALVLLQVLSFVVTGVAAAPGTKTIAVALVAGIWGVQFLVAAMTGGER